MTKKFGIFIAISLAGLLGVAFFIWTLMHLRESKNDRVQLLSSAKVGVGLPVPDFKVLDTRRDTVHTADIKKTKIINFWASWCGPCLQEMPSLAELAKNNRDQFAVIAISCDSNEKEFREALKLFPNFADSGIRIVFDPDQELMRAYGVKGFPESFVISSEGLLLKKIVGPIDWKTFALERAY